jgi:hypothetical protein
MMKFLNANKENILYPIILIALAATLFCSCGPRRRYIGVVKEVSEWDGKAKCLTKTKHTKRDTFIYVSPHRHQMFTVGETITFYTGGDLIVDAETNSR